MKRDYLYGTEYTLKQNRGMYHFNSDTELLGRFLIVNQDDNVLDIGCSSGALMLYAADGHPSSVCGIDLFEEVTACAKENMIYNHVEAELITGRVQDLKDRKFSLIVCNPPYFSSKNKDLVSANPYKAAARHEEYLNPDELFEAVKRLLSDHGRFCMVHRAERLSSLFDTAQRYGLACTRLKIAYETAGRNAKSAAMEFMKTKDRQLVIEPPAYMDDRDTFALRGGDSK